MVVSLGGEVAEVPTTIEQALDAVARAHFTVALLDIDLDGETSEPVAKALATTGKPFLVTTGFGGRTIAGFEEAPLLMKPYLPSQLGCGLIDLLRSRAAV